MSAWLKVHILHFLEGIAVAITQSHHLHLQICNLTIASLQIQLLLSDLPSELELFNPQSERVDHRLLLKNDIVQA